VLVALLGCIAIAGADDQAPEAQLWRNGPGIFNHPIHVVPPPTMTIPSGWPLDASGAITCLTCHAQMPAGADVADPKLRDFADDFLQGRGTLVRPDYSEFCARCHSDRNLSQASEAHWLGTSVAHVKPTSRGSGGGTLDAESRRCLECHDGVSASEALNPTGPARGTGMGDVATNHPVGVQYPSAARRGSGTRYRPASLLPREVQLPGGAVSCVSCHNLYAPGKNHLTVPIEGSELCFTCHDMR
jgi:predicted CXXCH cytochrome family protein